MPARDNRPRAALLVALALSATFGYGMLVDALKPGLRSPIDWVDITNLPPPPVFSAVRVCFVVSWAVAAGIAVLARVRLGKALDPVTRVRTVRTSQLAAAAVLLSPFPIFPVVVLVQNWWAALICVPSSAFALWGVHRVQRYRRMPFAIPVLAFGWGAFIATGVAGSMNSWFQQYGAAYLVDFGEILTDQSALDATINRVLTAMALNAGFFEEFGKGAGVALVYLVFRRHVDNVVSGVVLGAAVGLGFNWSESMLYMGFGNGEGAAYQYWARQSVGLMAAHTAFTAVIGAAFGIARQLSDRRSKLVVIGSGYLLAASAHVANNALMPHLTRLRDTLFGDDPWLTTLVAVPLTIIVLQGPVVLLYILLLRKGLRDQANAVSTELHHEANTGHGAVTPDEIPTLLNPMRRFFLRFTALRRGGVEAYRQVTRLHAAQFDLAMQRWHRTRWEVDPHSADEALLRDDVLRLKTPTAAEVPA